MIIHVFRAILFLSSAACHSANAVDTCEDVDDASLIQLRPTVLGDRSPRSTLNASETRLEITGGNTKGFFAHHRAVVLSREPNLVLIDDFLSPTEVNHLRNIVIRHKTWQKTGLVGKDGQQAIPDTVTSEISYLGVGNPDEIHTIQLMKHRIANATGLPVQQQERMAALRYHSGDFFRGHIDAHALPGRPTSSRVATMFIHVGEADAGRDGTTYFPMAIPTREASSIDGVLIASAPPGCEKLAGKDPSFQSRADMDFYLDGFDVAGRTPSEARAAGEGLAVSPKPGRALIWWSKLPDGKLDPRSQHAGCPPQGDANSVRKLTLTQWIGSERALG